MAKILVAAGGNLNSEVGSPAETIHHASMQFDEHGITLLRSSVFIQTTAFPAGSGQPDFTNAVMLAETETSPEEVLEALLEIEVQFGRVRATGWAARSLDLDLLSYDDLVTEGYWQAAGEGQTPPDVPPRLILPHPRLHARRFVVSPLCEIAPDWRHPALGLTALELEARLDLE